MWIAVVLRGEEVMRPPPPEKKVKVLLAFDFVGFLGNQGVIQTKKNHG
jgi:hypothetical protein